MLRVLLSLSIVLNGAPAAAATSQKIYTPVFQRRAMTKALSTFTNALGPREKAAVIDNHLAVGRAKDYREKEARLEELAVELVEITGQFVRFNRAQEITAAWSRLQSIATLVLRAAGENAVFSKEGSGDVGTLLIFGPAVGLFLTFLLCAFGDAGFGLQFLRPIAMATAPASLLFAFTGLVTLPFDNRVPGTTKLAHAVGFTPSMNEFWGKVGDWMKSDPLLADLEIKTIDDYRRFLETELRGAALDQACADALIAPPSSEV